MSAIASRLRKHWVELAWGAFTALNLVAMFRMDIGQTIPFHFIWVSLTLVYGFRTWGPNTTLIVCVAVCLLTSQAFLGPIMSGRIGSDEATEVPLMATMFLVMVWHARRRVAAMEEVRRLHEREVEFVRDASHNLRTPITVARGYAELIHTEHASTQTGEDAAMVLDELQKLTRISERLLTLVRSERPDFLRRTELDLEDLVNRTARRWMATAPRRWQVEANADGELLADAEQLGSALDAVIENAVAATADGGCILLRTRAEEGQAVLEVVDDGTGIRPDHLDRVFDRFWRARGEGDRETAGTGLGLAIVKAIVEAHHGTVTVASELGRGSRFTITMPGFRPAHPTASAAPNGVPPATSGRAVERLP
jgi:two-component system, OmpR family, sensor kinase